jgi:hypothetical protein
MHSIKPKFQRVPALNVNLLEGCRDPFIALMKEHGVEYEETAPNTEPPMNSLDFVEVFRDSDSWATAFATVISDFLKNKPNRNVIVTTRSKAVINCEGLRETAITHLLSLARCLVVTDMELMHRLLRE